MTKYVEDADLDYDPFHCCGAEDLHAFGCSDCGRPMVLCQECDTLYSDLDDLSEQAGRSEFSGAGDDEFLCPGCGHEFADGFLSDDDYRVSLADWEDAGLAELLMERARGSS